MCSPLGVVTDVERRLGVERHDHARRRVFHSAPAVTLPRRRCGGILRFLHGTGARGTLLDVAGVALTAAGDESTSSDARWHSLVSSVSELLESISVKHPNDHDAARSLVVQGLPKFVYYSSYGNLDSEIYLPHVIQNMERQQAERANLGQREQAKIRTLKVLFNNETSLTLYASAKTSRSTSRFPDSHSVVST